MRLSNSKLWNFFLISILSTTIAPMLVWGNSITLHPFPAPNEFFPGTDIRLFMSPNLAVGGGSGLPNSLARIGAVTLRDGGADMTGMFPGGAPGIFSGFDVDAIFFDRDGNLNTTGDQQFPTFFRFAPGSRRPTTNPNQQPTPLQPTFGSDLTPGGNGVDEAKATLKVLGDAVSNANVNVADGFLTLGDRVLPGTADPFGGTFGSNNAELEATFGEMQDGSFGVFRGDVTSGQSLFLIVGEVGGQQGEEIGTTVVVSGIPEIPEPTTALLLATGLLILGIVRRKTPSRTQ